MPFTSYLVIFGVVLALGGLVTLGDDEPDGLFWQWMAAVSVVALLTCGITAIFDAAGAL